MEKSRYNKEGADELTNEFCNRTGLDIYSNSRKLENVYLRVLLYKILSLLNGMNDRMISEYFAEYGIKRHRSSICVALNKINFYYGNHKYFRELYDYYFNDSHRYEILTGDTKQRRMASHDPKNWDELDNLIFDLPKGKRGEIYDLVNLRIKSWSWKNKDECKIITCSESIAGLMD